MTIETTYTVGQKVPQNDLPEPLQLNAIEIQNQATQECTQVEDYTCVVQVPSDKEVVTLENTLARDMHCLESMALVIETIKESNTPMTATTARVVQSSLERFGITLRLPSKEAFATGNASVSNYALEAVEAKHAALKLQMLIGTKKLAQAKYLNQKTKTVKV